MTSADQEFIESKVPAEHAERIAERVKRRLPSVRAREMAMASAAMSGVALGMWIVASLSDFQYGLTTVAIILTLATSALAAVASRDFHSLSEAIRSLKTENERMADNLWEASENEERASDLFDQMGDLVVVFDARRNISDANLNFAAALGLRMDEIIGKPLASLGIEVTRGRTRPITTPQEISINGRWYSWIEFRSPGAKLEKPLFRAVARDIHQHKEGERLLVEARQRAEAANEAKSQFLATVSHEIRTPLNGITGMTRLLSDTPLTGEQKTYVEAVSTSGQALVTLIEDLLDFSKIEAGRLDLRPERVAVRPFAESIVELMSARAHHKGVGIGLWVAQDVQEELVTDPDRLRQALLNLLGNAVKFTDAGGVSLEIMRLAGELRFTVRDNGPGIAAADHDRIFGEFEQADAGKTRRHGGAGLGLAITRRIVTALGGSVSVDSRPGEGAAFSIHLPDFSPARTGIKKPMAGKTAHVAMTSMLEAATVSQMLESLGARVTLHADLPSLSKSESLADVLLMDVRTVKALEGQSKFPPAAKRRIILIEPGERGLMPELLAKGFETYLVRPVRQKTLMRALAGTVANQIKVPQQTNPADLKPVNRALSILVAEDNEINALLVRSALTRAGHTVTVVGDGKSAVDEILSGISAHDIVLMDLHMPIMDGLDAIAAIRLGEDERGMKPVPVLALTADGQDEVERTVRSVGGNGFLVKPVDPARLVGLVEETAAAA